MAPPEFDVVGIGLNATDTVLVVPRFPEYAGKAVFEEEFLSPGGQTATAVITCARLGLRAKYIGTVGDDGRGRVQMESLRATNVNIDHVQVRRGARNQAAFIIVDRSTGERTIVERRPPELALGPEEILPEHITCARLLHIDGHDTAAAAHAARIARRASIPVTIDIDTVYAGVAEVLANVDYLLASSDFAREYTDETDPFRALERMQNEFGMRLAGMTLGAHGALVRVNGQFSYSPGFAVNAVDTTGAGDVFHGAFCYAVLQRMPIPEALEFSNAMAALNCAALGARGGIRSAAEARELMRRGERHVHSEYAAHARS